MSTLNTTTSSTRPSLGSSDIGKSYYETDTNKIIVWDGVGFDEYNADYIANPDFFNEAALNFDGVNDKVTIPHNSSLNGTNGFTISAWVNHNGSLSGYPQIVSKRAGNTAYQFNIKNTGELYFGVDGTSFVTGSTSLSSNTWYHVAVTWTNGTGAVAFYLNGSPDGTGTSKTSVTSNTGAFEIGKNPAFTNWFGGAMDEVVFYDYVLTSTEVNSLVQTVGGNSKPNDADTLNPVGWWRMGDSTGDTSSTIVNAATGSNSAGSSIDGSISGATSRDLSTTPDSIYLQQ